MSDIRLRKVGKMFSEAAEDDKYTFVVTEGEGSEADRADIVSALGLDSAYTPSAVAITGGTISGITDLDVAGTVDIVHTAAESDDHALEIDCDAAGFGDVKAIDVVYVTGAIAAGTTEEALLVNVDETAATGGDVVGIEILATEGSADKVIGLLAGAGVSPVEQLSGAFVDADTVLAVAVDETTALSVGGAGNVSVFSSDNDTMTVGSSAKFDEMEFLLDTFSSGAGIAPTFEYSTGVGTWATFVPADGTNGMRNNGVVAWLSSELTSWATGTGSEYLIRVTRTRNSLSTTPIMDKVQVVGAVEYYWDADGHISANTGTFSGNQINIATTQTPASASATGTTGTICWDASYIYVCTATNTWKRVAIATW
jgi:hypothetical protein